MDYENDYEKRFAYVYGIDVSRKYPNVSISIERITPDTAAAMLETNVNNRNKKNEPLAIAMKNGEWRLNGDAIRFSSDGVLLDGQHRLLAIIASGIAVDTIVIRGLDPDSQVTIDSGVKRQVADFLKMRGYKDASKVGAIGVSLMKVDNVGLKMSYGHTGYANSRLTTTSILDYIERNYETRIAPIVRLCDRFTREFRCVRTGMVAPLIDRFIRIDVDDTYCFIEQVTGMRAQCQPVQMLVKRLNDEDKDKQSKLSPNTIAALIVKTWNAYMQGEEIKALRYRMGGSKPESFPEIFGDEGGAR